jgi:hypothetical protein
MGERCLVPFAQTADARAAAKLLAQEVRAARNAS